MTSTSSITAACCIHAPEIVQRPAGRRHNGWCSALTATRRRSCAGQPIFEKGEHTGALPGRLVRAGRERRLTPSSPRQAGLAPAERPLDARPEHAGGMFGGGQGGKRRRSRSWVPACAFAGTTINYDLKMTSAKIPVLIAGGGPVGLALAIELGMSGIAGTLVERRDGSIGVPKMSGLSIRSMELNRRWGIAEKAKRGGPGPRRTPTTSSIARALPAASSRARRCRPMPRRNCPTRRSPVCWLRADFLRPDPLGSRARIAERDDPAHDFARIFPRTTRMGCAQLCATW